MLDEQSGLTLISERLQFQAKCHLGPTGALRAFLQDFSAKKNSVCSAQRIVPWQNMKCCERSTQLAQRSSTIPQYLLTPILQTVKMNAIFCQAQQDGGELLSDLCMASPGAPSLHDDHSSTAQSCLDDADPRARRQRQYQGGAGSAWKRRRPTCGRSFRAKWLSG